MKVHGASELSKLKMLQRQTADVRAKLDRAAQEATTGLKADTLKATGGNLARLYGIERMLERNAAHQTTIGLAELWTDVTQDRLGRVEALAGSLSVDLLSAGGLADMAAGRVHASAARSGFLETMAILNTQVAGQSIFAGIRTDGPAVAPGAAVLAALDGLVAGLDVPAAIAAIEAFFDGTGDGTFRGDHHLGDEGRLVAAELGDGQRVAYAVTALDPGLIETLKGLAIAAMAHEQFAGAAPEQRAALLRRGGEILLQAKGDVQDLRARTGVAQEAIERAKVQRSFERETLEIARARMVGADPYDAAALFQAMTSQLESVYTVTARLAQLRFVNFVR